MSRTGIREWHSYLGLLIAPSVLFFALTGAAQIFNLHEAHGDYRPFAIVAKFSSVHKDQVFALGHHDAPPVADVGKSDIGAALPAAVKDDDDNVKPATLMLKIFFLIVALCLSVSTAFGLWMGLTQMRRRRLAWMLVLAGVLVPAGLLVL